MKLILKDIYKCPACKSKLELTVHNESKDAVHKGILRCECGHEFPIVNDVPDFTWPKELCQRDEENRLQYEILANRFNITAEFTFKTFKSDETEVRKKMIDQLSLTKNSIVLEVGAGDGASSKLIAEILNEDGKLFFQELSPATLCKAQENLRTFSNIDFSVANACHISFPDNYFDAAYHFGGISTFSDIGHCLKELSRVVKPGGKVVVSDEGIGKWLRETDFFKIISTSNPLYKFEFPMSAIPVEARNVKMEWILMGAFYVLEFTVGEGEPEADYHVPIPGKRGGTHWTRYYGKLEGITEDAKQLAIKASGKSGKSIHRWLDETILNAAKKELDKH
ncbi:MAG: methyltransferase domain-containing protein [Bacteroidia bacterium]